MRARGIFRGGVAASVLAAVAALLVSGALTTVVGASPLDAYRQIWNGSFGSSYAVGVTATKALPLVFVAIGFTVAFRAGVFNIGLEGQIYTGGLAAALVGANLHAPAVLHLPVTILAGAAGGAAWALLPALLKVWLEVNEIVTSLLLNYVAIYLTSYLIGSPVKDPAAIYPQTESVLPSAQLPVLVGGTKINAGIVLALVVAALVWLLLARTTLGYELRTVGASTRVAQYVGIDVRRSVLVAFVVSGACGGLAGTVEILGNQFRLLEGFSPGWGYTGIAVALLGGVTAWGSVVAGFFFGVLGSGADQMQFRLGVPSAFVLVVQAIAVIFVLASGWIREQISAYAARRRPLGSP
jgi:ABC-type uncharacterized transport system permease subunit